MEDENPDTVRAAVSKSSGTQANLAAAIRKRFEPIGGVQMPEIPRSVARAARFRRMMATRNTADFVDCRSM